MAKVKYLGPGDSIEIDGVNIAKGESADLTPEQVSRLRSDPTSQLEVEDAADTAEERARIRDQQDAHRDQRAKDAESAAKAATEIRTTKRTTRKEG